MRAVLEMLLDEHASWLSFLMLCAWTVSKVVEWAWSWLKIDPTLGDRLTGERHVKHTVLRRAVPVRGATRPCKTRRAEG